MGRPVKWRRIDQMPTVMHFWPANQHEPSPADNTLLVEEYEAIRLKDLEGLEQEECAEQMQISRPTFQRILMIARQKIADSLTHGKGISIEGGTYTRNVCPVRCLDCGESWEESIETLAREKSAYSCPHCHSTRIVCAPFTACGNDRNGRGRFCQRSCWRNGWSDQLNKAQSGKEEMERESDVEHHDSD